MMATTTPTSARERAQARQAEIADLHTRLTTLQDELIAELQTAATEAITLAIGTKDLIQALADARTLRGDQ